MVRDDHGIPQVYASSSDDLFYAQGYVQAQDRFFEMDFRRHVTLGRLSELLGKDALEADMYVRTMGWRRVAEQELSLLSPETLSYLEAFSAGVNAYMDSHTPSQMSLEYSLLALNGLDYAPEERTPADSVAWLKAMAWDLRGNMEEEIQRALMTVNHSAEEIASLPGIPDRHQPIVNQGRWSTACSSRTPAAATPASRPGPRCPRRSPTPSSGSAPAWSGCRRCSGTARASAATPGPWTGSTPRPASRSWPTTRTWAPRCPASGTRWACTAPSSARPARSTRPGSRSPGSRAW